MGRYITGSMTGPLLCPYVPEEKKEEHKGKGKEENACFKILEFDAITTIL